MKKFLSVFLVLIMVFALTASFTGCTTTEPEEETTEPIVPEVQIEKDDKAAQLQYVVDCINAIKKDKPFAITREGENKLKDLDLTKNGEKVGEAQSLADIYFDRFRDDIKNSEVIASRDFTEKAVIGRDTDENIVTYDESLKGDFFTRSGDVDILALTMDDIADIKMIDGYDLKALNDDQTIVDEEDKKIEGFGYYQNAELQRIFVITLNEEENPASNPDSAITAAFDVDADKQAGVCEELSKYNDYFSFGGYNTKYTASITCYINKLDGKVTSFSMSKTANVTSNEDGLVFTDKLPSLAELGKIDMSVWYDENFNYSITWEDPATQTE